MTSTPSAIPPNGPAVAPAAPDAPSLSEAQRASTLDRFELHRSAWQRNPALRALYGRWYRQIGQVLERAPAGPRIELGSGAGFAAEFIPGLVLTDLVAAPWHHREVGADRLPFADGAVAALVLFDVLHHLSAPAAFFEEAERALGYFRISGTTRLKFKHETF